MAKGRGKGTKKASESLVPQVDPRAPLDGRAFLAAAKPVLAALTEDLLARADGSAGVTRALKLRHAEERKQERTADGYEVWRRQVVVQVAAAWLLSCVFVRTLEDRGLLARNRIAGAGARDGQQMFFQIAPYLTERDYLLAVFREVAHLDAVRGLFARERSLVWRLAPSAEGARRVLELFRAGDAEAPAFRFGQADTRFLGDLYQDLNEEVRERFALLQTPDFVEEFILDRTLEPALEKFGLERTELIDPTCGSGHFLLGAFGRLVERRLREEPGVDPVVAAKKALDAVYGVDVNPYAVMIARFRLTLAFLEKAGFGRLDGAPRVEPNVVVADSLLHNVQLEQRSLVELEGVALGDWEVEAYRLEDDARAKEVLGKGYAAVVGNPPYITVKDSVLRERYRKMYERSAAGKYSIAAPFTERFFQLARAGGRVGMITANSFMKREFGKKLIEQYLPTVNLDVIVNTSGAYIPGHGTPTVLLFGSQEKAVGDEVLTVLANRGEPATPEDPRQGVVWGSIAGHWNEVGYEDEYVSVVRMGREGLGQHPWSLGGGGAAELKEWLEERASSILDRIASAVGFSCVTGEDEVYLLPPAAAKRINAGQTRPLVTGECVRDWALDATGHCVFPYTEDLEVGDREKFPRELAYLWPYRTNLGQRRRFGTPMLQRGLTWYELQELYSEKLRTPLTITFAFVATHNHFVLDRGGKVFNRSAPIIKLPETAAEDDHLALLAYLNSSTACFWMKQVFFPKSSQRDLGEGRSLPEKLHYEFASTGLKPLPLPPTTDAQRSRLITLARTASELAQTQNDLSGHHIVDEVAAHPHRDRSYIAEIESQRLALSSRLVAIQEEIDRIVYDCFGLTSDHLRLLEVPLYKRQWTGRRGVFGHSAKTLAEEVQDAAKAWLQERAEDLLRDATRPMTLHELATQLASAPSVRRICTELLDATDVARTIQDTLDQGDAVPFLPTLYLRPTGLEKRAAWQHTWNLQRREDLGEAVAPIPVPPKYKPADFIEQPCFSLRGPLDVPKERFISYPGCASTHDPSPIYGWAGWDHAQRAQALAQLYLARKTEEAWPAERLTPMLAGLDELLFWLELWHGDPHPDYGMPLSSFYADFISSECRELGLTLDDLRSWRPPKGFGKAAKPAKPRKTTVAPSTPDDPPPAFALTSDPDPDPAPKPARPRKPRAPKKSATRS